MNKYFYVIFVFAMASTTIFSHENEWWQKAALNFENCVKERKAIILNFKNSTKENMLFAQQALTPIVDLAIGKMEKNWQKCIHFQKVCDRQALAQSIVAGALTYGSFRGMVPKIAKPFLFLLPVEMVYVRIAQDLQDNQKSSK